MKKNQSGISHVLLPLVIVVLIAVGFAGYRVFSKGSGPSKEDLAKLDGGGKKLKMEAFPGKTASQVSAFTGGAKTYEY